MRWSRCDIDSLGTNVLMQMRTVQYIRQCSRTSKQHTSQRHKPLTTMVTIPSTPSPPRDGSKHTTHPSHPPTLAPPTHVRHHDASHNSPTTLRQPYSTGETLPTQPRQRPPAAPSVVRARHCVQSSCPRHASTHPAAPACDHASVCFISPPALQHLRDRRCVIGRAFVLDGARRC